MANIIYKRNYIVICSVQAEKDVNNRDSSAYINLLIYLY